MGRAGGLCVSTARWRAFNQIPEPASQLAQIAGLRPQGLKVTAEDERGAKKKKTGGGGWFQGGGLAYGALGLGLQRERELQHMIKTAAKNTQSWLP